MRQNSTGRGLWFTRGEQRGRPRRSGHEKGVLWREANNAAVDEEVLRCGRMRRAHGGELGGERAEKMQRRKLGAAEAADPAACDDSAKQP